MKNSLVLMSLQNRITRDQKFAFTILSYITILLIFVNVSFINFSAIGVVTSAIYLVINATYLGHAVFREGNAFVEFMLGLLLLTVILGLVGWAVMILYNLSIIGAVMVLFITSSFASFLNKKVKSENVG